MSPTTALDELWTILLSRLNAANDTPLAGSGPRAGFRVAERPAAAVVPLHLSPGQSHAIVKEGIPSRTLAPLSDYLGVGKGAAAAYLDLDRATASRKEAKDEPLPVHAAESLLRLLELDRMARDTFDTPEEAAGWLRRAHPMLDGDTPLACAKSSFGAQRVKDILLAIQYGGVV